MQIIRISRFAIVGFGVFMGVVAIILNEIGLSLGWVYLFMGIVIGSAVFPIYSCLTWKKCTATAAIAGAPLVWPLLVAAAAGLQHRGAPRAAAVEERTFLVGPPCNQEVGTQTSNQHVVRKCSLGHSSSATLLVGGMKAVAARCPPSIHRRAGAVIGQWGALIAWLVTCQAEFGEINVDNLGSNFPMLAGNVTALGLSLIVTTVVTLVRPEDYDWEEMKKGIDLIEEDGTDKLADQGEDSEESLREALRCAALLFCTLPAAGTQSARALFPASFSTTFSTTSRDVCH